MIIVFKKIIMVKSVYLLKYKDVEELVSTLSQPVSTLYQAWMQVMDEVQKNSSTDAPERVLTLCVNLCHNLQEKL